MVRVLRIGPPGSERPVVADDDGVTYDLGELTGDVDGAFLADAGIERTRDALAAGRLAPIGIEGQRVGAPLARPSAVVCIGQNYAAHARESGAEPPAHPVLFFKHPNTVVGPYDDVLLPRGSTRTDWEVELAVVIGRRARYLDSPDSAGAYIGGYAVSNDVSERAFQLEVSGGQWSKGKSCETFNPLGPFLVPTGADVSDIKLCSWVNGEPRQESTTADMIFSVPTLVYELSQFMVLEPGDVINTGTPEGVALSGRFPYLAAGDVVECEIDGLGRQRQQVAAG
ncbi:MAG: fumarylacetoacetate hydrolase family protein [Streptosporangiales bacterium]